MPTAQSDPPVEIRVYTQVEFSQDGGNTWKQWCFWQPGLTYNPPEPLLRRASRMYPEWQFRLNPPAS